MAPNTAALATSIAGLTVSGVTFKDVSAIPRIVKSTDCPIFFPDPAEWFQNMQTSSGLAFVGQAGQENVTRTLRYIYLHCPSIAANTITSKYSAMAAKVDAIYGAIADMNNGAAMVTSISVSRFGELEAPAAGSQIRNVFFGCFFDINFLELA